MRRSSREIKKPDIYVPLSQGSARVVSAKRGHETDEESKSNGAASDQDSDEDDDASEVEGKAGKRSVKKARKQGVSKTTKVDSVMRKLKRVSIQVADEETDSPDGKVTSSSKGRTKKAEKVIISGNAFFDSLQAGKKCSTLVSDWIARYTTHRVACNVEILNFIMLSAGATKCWIKSDIDLEPLDGAEILELLTDMVQAMTSSDKPTSVSLRSATKQAGKTFSDRYVAFWSAFLPALLESSDGAEDSGLEILKGVISIMISCSAMPIAGIRLAITLGLLAIARSLQSSLLGCRNKSDFAARQLEAEGKVSAKGKKFMAIERQKKDYDSTIEAMQAISDGLFDSIFVHRYKDTMPDVRCSCAAHLGEWLPIDPASCFRDEYLKYLGWMCSDRDTNVRREIVKSIDKLLEAKDVSHQAKLVNFIERFTERFIEMAVGDVDDAVCVLALKLLRHLQRKGLLDAVMSEDQLDRVDEVVFDSSASLSARREAMGFVFDHTEGFEVDDSNYDDDKHPVGKRKGKENVLHKQRVYQQLLTITEFAEHHLVELTLALPPSRSSTAVENGLELGLEYVRMIVEACADLPQKALLRDWEAMTALLLRDGEESESLPPLSPLHASILIRLFVYSAQTCVCTTVNGSFSEINAKISSADAENLSECLQEDLVPLLTRYRDNDDNLRTLLLLLSCYDTSTVSQKVIKPLLKLLSDIYLSSNSSLVLEGVANSFRCMHLKAEHLRATVDATLSTLLRSIWSVITKNSPQIKRGKDFTGALYSLCSSLSRLKVLWTQMNCRRLFPVSTDELADELIESAELLLPHSGIGASNASDAESLCVSSSQDIARCLFAMVLWPTRDLYMHAKQQYGETGSESSHEQSDSEWEGKAAEIISLRDKLIDCLHTWLQIEPEEETSYDPLGVEAFKLISDLRVLFSSRNKDCKYVSELAWTPPQDLVNSLRLVFDRSTSMLALQMESLGDSEEDAKKRALLSAQCVKDLLCPLGIATIYNIENLNRRQAAVITFLHCD